MNFKNINKFLIFTFFLFLYSCFINNNELKIQNDYIENDIFEKNNIIDLSNEIASDSNTNDFYDYSDITSLKLDSKFKKIKTINTYGKKYMDSRILDKLIINNKLYSLDHKSKFSVHNLDNFDLIFSLFIEHPLIDKDTFPTSFSRINNLIFISFSNGTIASLDLKANILWIKNYKGLIKTPIKILNENLIILLENSIVSINSNNGEINWNYKYTNSNYFQSQGGDIIQLNQFLFFNLPNNKFGKIDTVFGEKDQFTLFDKYSFNNFRASTNKLHTYEDMILYFSDLKYLFMALINEEKFTLNNLLIPDVHSFKFFNNSLIIKTKENYLKAYNIKNKNLFWKIDLKDFIKINDPIIQINSNTKNLFIFFKSGQYIVINSLNGDILLKNNLKINNINKIKYYNNYFYIEQINGKTTFLINE